jgi:hypothetical protein
MYELSSIDERRGVAVRKPQLFGTNDTFPHKNTNYTITNPHKHFHPSKSNTMKLNIFFLSAAALVNAANAAETVNLGTAGNYAILTKTGISTVPASVITGNIAVSPIASTAMTGFNLMLDVGGTFSTDLSGQAKGNASAANYAAPMPATLITAVGDMETAYTDAAGRVNNDAARINLAGGLVGGLNLTAGIYTFQVDITITDDITFQGNATDVFILQTTGSIVQSSGTHVFLSGGVQAKNIFWVIAGAVNVGAGAHMEGILLIKTAATFNTGASLNGRVLAQSACTLQMNTITEPSSV